MLTRFSRAFVIIIVALFLLTTLAFFHAPSRAYIDPWTGEIFGEGGVEKDLQRLQHPETLKAEHPHGTTKQPTPSVMTTSTLLSESSETWTATSSSLAAEVTGGVIMSKLGNATAKAELGRATWKLLHTMTLRYPEKPTDDERDALKSYFTLFSRLYPCGECAAEFQQLLKKYPVQTSSRRAAALWLCSVHNEVNARLKKPEFDCANLDATYDCGCGDDPISSSSSSAASPTATSNGKTDIIGHLHDPMEDESIQRDKDTGVGMIKGGR
ncbi:ERV/ALR sulfhydryl oxidase domain-containing protein [Cristinia sonorae]|uniref:Sulfhydryl oxidase n=1 Tax=Cristinia sonorae TaxID=1940300 RepID=A0A8K0UUA1_9AGAR|nr:ERV/ALR sulfhydryl oxidase domain-containing protein [Cristinia sonorae]